MIKPVKVRNLVIGDGVPKICMPLVARNFEELQEGMREALLLQPDLVEWRADYYEGLTRREIPGLLSSLREKNEQPILFTFRSQEEGGVRPLPKEQQLEWMLEAADAGVDLLDAELSLGEKAICPLLRHAHAYHLPVIVSNHHFEGTPSAEEMVDILCRQQACGADMAKLAVMPHSPADVLALLEATLRMREQFAEIPLITMSMGALGFISRISGGTFGSAMTFGAGKKSSAPGQPEIGQLRALLQKMESVR